MDGLTMAKQVRKNGYHHPIVLLTFYTCELIDQQAVSAGIDFCIQKQADIH